MQHAIPDHDDEIRVPRAALVAAAAIVIVAISAAGFARLSGVGRSVLPHSTMVEQRALLFEDQADGAVLVRDASSHAVVDTIQPGAFGFVRVAMRGMARDRRAHGVGADRQFLLTRWRDGRVTLDDPETGRRLDLSAFGRPNGEAFERLLATREEASNEGKH